MIPVMQTKVVVKNSKGDFIIRGNCFAACVASILELPITEVPNVEVFYHLDNGYWAEVMLTFLESKGYELSTNEHYRVYHDSEYNLNPLGKLGELAYWNRDVMKYRMRDNYYLVSGKSKRDVTHICIFQNGKLVHDPHPSKEGLLTFENFQSLEKLNL